jgi:hypothetical protein
MQEIDDKTCKKAVKDAMHSAKYSVWRDDAQIEMYADRTISEDETISREVYFKAYKASQAALMSKPVPFSLTGPMGSQILQAMLFAEEYEGGFDAAYAYIKDRVEAAFMPQSQESESV